MPSRKFRSYVMGAALVAVLAVIAVAVAASPASAVHPGVLPPPDGNISCKATGTTADGGLTYGTQVCLSFQTAFNVYKTNYPTNCYQGVQAEVYYYNTSNNQYTLRWGPSIFCEDGVWRVSSAWGSNETRFSQAWIYSSGADYQILQYKR
jgi:hypothetical protein